MNLGYNKLLKVSPLAKRFSDFASDSAVMDGEKMKIANVVDKEIEVISFKVSDSQYKKNERCLTLQFKLCGEKHVIFTGSNVLIEQCEKYKDEMPFMTVIKQVEKYYTFS